MSNWKTEDKAWMKARKLAWKDVKRKIDEVFHFNKDEKRSIKNYFLLGRGDPDTPLTEMDGGLLLEMWLHPDQSEAHWERLRGKYTERDWFNARTEFGRVNRRLGSYISGDDNVTLLTYPPDGGSVFDGLEERMCYWFRFGRLRREEWPELDDEQFLDKAKDTLPLARSFDNYIQDPLPNPYNITRYRVAEWKDAMCLAYEGDFLGLEWMVESVCGVLTNKSRYPQPVVQLAEELAEVFNNPDLPQAARERIAELSVQYGCQE